MNSSNDPHAIIRRAHAANVGMHLHGTTTNSLIESGSYHHTNARGGRKSSQNNGGRTSMGF